MNFCPNYTLREGDSSFTYQPITGKLVFFLVHSINDDGKKPFGTVYGFLAMLVKLIALNALLLLVFFPILFDTLALGFRSCCTQLLIRSITDCTSQKSPCISGQRNFEFDCKFVESVIKVGLFISFFM